MEPATRFPTASEPYSAAADFSILPKFFPGLPMSLPAAAALAEYERLAATTFAF